jgi:hypothetical protein
MAKHLLDDAQISSTGQQMRCKRVSELVGVDGFLDSGQLCVMTHQLPDACRCQGMTANGDKDFPARFR